MKQLIPFLVVFFYQLFTVNVTAQTPGVIWQKLLGGSKADAANDVIINPDGSMIAVGFSFSDDGNITGHHGANTTSDGWIVKLDPDGNIIWQQSVGGTANDYFNTIIKTNDAGYLCTGFTYSNDGDVSGNHGTADVWAVKINAAGNVLWSQCYGGSKTDTASDAVMLHDGSFAVMATSNSVDGDVLSGISTRADYDAWVIKTDADGNLQWEKCIDRSNDARDDAGLNITESYDNKIMAYIQGGKNQSFFSMPVTFERVVYKGLLYQLDETNGDLSLSNLTGSATTLDNQTDMAMFKDNSGYYFMGDDLSFTGYPGNCYNHSRAFARKNPQGTIADTSRWGLENCAYWATGGIDYYYTNYVSQPHGMIALSNRSFMWVGKQAEQSTNKNDAYISGQGILGITYESDDRFKSIKALPSEDEFIVVGFVGPQYPGSHGGADFWVVKVQSLNRITGNVFIDYNNNNIQDPGEPPFSKAMMKTIGPGITQAAYLGGSVYSNDVGLGTYKTALKVLSPYYTYSTDSTVSAFTTYRNTVNINYPVHPIPGSRDYAVHSWVSAPRPGFEQDMLITYFNNGIDTMMNKNIVLIKNSHLQFLSSTPPAANISGDTITWNVSNLLPDQRANISLHMRLDTIPLVHIGDRLAYSVTIDTTGDLHPDDNLVDNATTIFQAVTGSYDPNDKQESYGGSMPLQDAVNGKYLNYTVRFQNTGADTAFNIVVRDTLDAQLDSASFEMIGASHAYQLNIKNGKYVTWKFNDIKLLDSFNNEALSHGYISYRIKPKLPVGIGDVISNRAAIYFDFNPAVLTNNQQTKISGTPVQAVWIGAVSVAWEDPLNWNIHKVPDINTKVIIPAAVPNYPEINSNTGCYSIHIDPAATVLIKTGFKLNITGKNN